MFASLKKTIAGSVAALAIGLALAGAATPVSAQSQFHGGHGGGWHGGWHGGFGWGPVAALGAAGLVAGAIAASEGPYYNDCTGYNPVYDGYGNYLGQRPVNICQ